jgi:heme-degrading monooxygenase HmoA
MARPIQLHADLAIDPAQEAEAIRYFESVYRPTASRFEGYIDLHLLRLSAALVGSAPAGVNYRFSITFTSEALRQKWVASDAHTEVWGRLETFLTRHEYDFLLFDLI